MNANHDSNLTCASIADELTHLVLGELEPARAAAVEAHCATCATCRAERELLAKSAALIEADAPKLATVLRLSESREQALLATAAATVAPVRRFWTFERLSAAAAAILAVCVTGNWIWRKYDVDAIRPEGEVARLAKGSDADASKATVQELKQDGALKVAVGETGEVAFSRSEPGDWTLWVQCPGYYKYSAKLSLEAGRESVHEAELITLQSGPPQGKDANAEQRSEHANADGKVSPEKREALKERDEIDRSHSKQASLRVVVRDAEGHIVPQAKVSLFKGDSPLDNAKKIAKNGMVGLELPSPEEGRSGSTTALPEKELAARSELSDVDKMRALGYLDGEEEAEGDEGPIGVKYVATAPDNLVDSLSQTPELKEAVSKLTSSAELRRELMSLGYGDGGGGGDTDSFNVRQQIGNHLYSNDDVAAAFSPGFVGYDLQDLPEAEANPGGVADAVQIDRNSATVVRGALPLIAATPFATPGDVAALEDQLRRVAAAGRTVDVDALVKSFLDRLAPRQGEAPRDMFFRWFGDNPAIPTRIDARSTFGMEVDTASYNLARGYLAKGTLPPKAAVRTEEFVNAFKQGLAAPAAAVDGVANPDVFALTTELAPSPFGEGKQLLRIGLKAREIDRSARQPASLTFVIDVSGSMEEGGRLELVKQALRLLVAQLDERDSIAIAVFSDNARIALPPTRASEQATILAALDPLRPEQSTNAGAGLRLGYDLAMTQRDRAGDHRVILCSDGVANAGVTDPDQLTARIRQCKSERIYLTTVGVGMNNVNDALLEQLAREGDGNCHYVDGLAEARELFVDKLTGTLSTVARDAKIQVEFEPQAVRAFRQLGYENRAIAHADFRNDKVDAGEVGAGHEVVALYELDLAPDAAGPIATVHCRYEEPRSQTVREQARVCFAADAAPTVAAASPRWRLDAAVAEFAELLRQSVHARDGSFGAVERLAEPLVAELADDKDVPEFVALVKQAARLPDLLPRRGELSRCVDELKKVRCWQQELGQSDPAQKQANGDLMRQLEEQNRKLEQALRDALAGAARGR